MRARGLGKQLGVGALLLVLLAGPAVAAPSGEEAARDTGTVSLRTAPATDAEADLQGVEGLTGGVAELGPAVVEQVPARLYPDPAAAPGADAGDPVTDSTTPRPIDVPRQPIGRFEESTRQPQPIAAGFQPYQSGKVNPVPFGRVDTTGVRVFKADWDGKVYDHPIAQAQYALNTLESYRLTGDPVYLDVAVRNAQRIIDRRHVVDGAWYFPYDFTFDLHRNGRGVLTPPWASGMASGQALSTFVRLHEVTGQQKWRDAADATFAAFLQAPDGRGYFSSWVDAQGLLWLEEYSRYPVTDSERVLNGHMWSMYGIWDYWMMNDYAQADAERLWRGALYTVERTGMSIFRNRNWYSLYSAWQRYLAHTYHVHHQQQFLMLYRMSHDSVWISRAGVYREDHRTPNNTTGFAVISPRTTVAYRLDDSAQHPKDRTMRVLETRSLSITRTTGAAYDRRGRMPDGGPHVLRLSAGYLQGWWVVEDHRKAWSKTMVDIHSYLPDAKLYVDAPTRLAIYRFDTAGNNVEGKLVTLQPGTFYGTHRSATVEGRPSWLLRGGAYDGWVLPQQATVKVHRNPGWRVG
ncbi:D-glucuronyl C5-epimerase family protein [Ornithinimicrobium flavum]|uniref:D-glucuronyl C5-epimerase family protein n=1 Tax=Ornithinimicrobium flavum TaxID=1288636 RepID=UPI001305105A|nr:D-glucuronyl C5-epimerase family protein [Ornithinimicrobium flavum]